MSRTQMWLNDWALLMMRVMLGVVFMFHGSQKLFSWFGGNGLSGMAEFLDKTGVPLPYVSAILAGSAEFFGGAAILLGVGVRLAVMPMAFTMLVAIYTVHWGAFSGQANGMEYPLTLAVMLVSLGLMGPGRLSLSTIVAACRSNVPKEPQGAVPHPQDVE